MEGKVKWFNNERGYGFIEYMPNEDVFVHYTAIRQKGYKTLIKGEEIVYELVKTEEGYKAKNVKTKKADE